MEKEIKVDKKDYQSTTTVGLCQTVKESEGWSNIAQIEAWIDRNMNSMDHVEFCRQLKLRLKNTRTLYGYELVNKENKTYY